MQSERLQLWSRFSGHVALAMCLTCMFTSLSKNTHLSTGKHENQCTAGCCETPSKQCTQSCLNYRVITLQHLYKVSKTPPRLRLFWPTASGGSGENCLQNWRVGVISRQFWILMVDEMMRNLGETKRTEAGQGWEPWYVYPFSLFHSFIEFHSFIWRGWYHKPVPRGLKGKCGYY